MRIIDCIDCDGTGVNYESDASSNYLPLECTCKMCNGEKKITVDEEFAKHILGEVDHE